MITGLCDEYPKLLGRQDFLQKKKEKKIYNVISEL